MGRFCPNDGEQPRSAGRDLPARAYLGQAIPAGVEYMLRCNKQSNPKLCDLLEEGRGGGGKGISAHECMSGTGSWGRGGQR